MAIKYWPGETVIKCRPLCQALAQNQKGIRCDLCLRKSSSLKRCAKCQKMSYCGKACQTDDWKAGHKYECHTYATCRPDLMDEVKVRFMLRLYLLVTKGGVDTKQFTLHDGRQRCLRDLISHEKDVIMSESQELLKYRNVAAGLKQLPVTCDVDECLLFRLFCQFGINRYGLPADDTDMELGHGLYIESAIFDHSCDPNACFLFDSNEMEVRAVKPIEDGQEVFISYHDTYLGNVEETKTMRQDYLKTNYFFTCKCTRCESNFDQVFDRKRMKYLGDQMEAKRKQHQFKDAWNLAVQCLPIWRQLYGEFHRYQTGLLLQVVHDGIMARVHEQKEFKDLIARLEKSVDVTERKGSFLYEGTKKTLQVAKSMSTI